MAERTSQVTKGMTWVVVADAGHADIYLRKKRFGPLERAQSLDASDARLKEHDLSSDAPGRTFDREGVGRHSYEPAHTAKEHARENFARRITRDLDAGRIADDFQHLVIVAAPALLGDIRKHLSRATHHLVSAEIDKEMTGMDLSAICAEIDRHG